MFDALLDTLAHPDAVAVRFGVLVALLLIIIGIQMWRARREPTSAVLLVAGLRTEMLRELTRYGVAVHELGNAMMKEYNGILELHEHQERTAAEQQQVRTQLGDLFVSMQQFFSDQQQEVSLLRAEIRQYSTHGGAWSRAQIQQLQQTQVAHHERLVALEQQMDTVYGRREPGDTSGE